MSSHHIVRDNQEPALFIDSPIHNFEWIGQLLEWSPILIVNAKYMDWIVMHDLKPDVILSETEINNEQKEKYKSDWFPLEIAEGNISVNLISALQVKNQVYLNWICLEENLKDKADFVIENKLNYNLQTHNKRCVPVYTQKFSKWLNPGVYSLLNNDEEFYLNNEKITSKNIEIKVAETVTLTSNKPYFFCENL
jgi:thiamine pyrophosphokinase